MTRAVIADPLIRIGTWMGVAHVTVALIAHFTVPPRLEKPLGLIADPWFRRETGTVNAGFAYGMIRTLTGHRDATFVRSTAISGLLMAVVRIAATMKGDRTGPLSAFVIASDLLLGLGGMIVAGRFDREAVPA